MYQGKSSKTFTVIMIYNDYSTNATGLYYIYQNDKPSVAIIQV